MESGQRLVIDLIHDGNTNKNNTNQPKTHFMVITDDQTKFVTVAQTKSVIENVSQTISKHYNENKKE